jgi:Arc/MetJ-type ribon-helix-helix transcriptional regulator
MKTVTRNISLAEDLARFAEREVEEGGYGSVSAYFAELVRQRRQAQIDADLVFLKGSMAKAGSGPEPVDVIVAASRGARAAMRRERWEPRR